MHLVCIVCSNPYSHITCTYLYIHACGVADKTSNKTNGQALNTSDQATKRSPQNAMTKSKFLVWPNAVVPYTIDHSLSKLRRRINW